MKKHHLLDHIFGSLVPRGRNVEEVGHGEVQGCLETEVLFWANMVQSKCH